MIYNRACLYTNYKSTTKTTNGKLHEENVDCLHGKYIDSVPYAFHYRKHLGIHKDFGKVNAWEKGYT